MLTTNLVSPLYAERSIEGEKEKQSGKYNFKLYFSDDSIKINF